MKLALTRRGDYAVRAMIALGRDDGAGWLSAARIAEQMRIPARFLPQIMAELARARLVDSRPGRTGGYRLARLASRISVLEVIEAVEGNARSRTCVLRGAPCGLNGTCDAHVLFAEAHEALLGRLAEAPLTRLIRPTLSAPDRE